MWPLPLQTSSARVLLHEPRACVWNCHVTSSLLRLELMLSGVWYQDPVVAQVAQVAQVAWLKWTYSYDVWLKLRWLKYCDIIIAPASADDVWGLVSRP